MWGSGPQSPFVTARAPLITYELETGDKFNVSVASNTYDGWAALYVDTTLTNGMISNTWGEYTLNGQYSIFGVSRTINMNGRGMSIEGTQRVSNME
ncbi:unnamed protein product [Aureobasidium uvarum]|uniref:Uncharacterized protein n=1 Tax=Aureobasidium uvarum TaxID=2773716 RepID=A0A9N8KH50_9PEZI|nr:unnamed protein product [Aureobasidium uvarum]